MRPLFAQAVFKNISLLLRPTVSFRFVGKIGQKWKENNIEGSWGNERETGGGLWLENDDIQREDSYSFFGKTMASAPSH